MTLIHKVTSSILDEPIEGLGTLREGMRAQFTEEENAKLSDEDMNRLLAPWGMAALKVIAPDAYKHGFHLGAAQERKDGTPYPFLPWDHRDCYGAWITKAMEEE